MGSNAEEVGAWGAGDMGAGGTGGTWGQETGPPIFFFQFCIFFYMASLEIYQVYSTLQIERYYMYVEDALDSVCVFRHGAMARRAKVAYYYCVYCQL